MKKIFLFSLLTVLIVTCFTFDADAQYRRKKKKKKKKPKTDQKSDYFDDSGIIHRLWYGSGGNLQFAGIEDQRQFTIGLTPMVGYKITENFSAGPKIGFNYTSYRNFDTNGVANTVKLTSFSGGAFARLKFLNMLFIHGELEAESRENAFLSGSFIALDDAGEPLTQREGRTNGYLGLGYNNSGGALGFDIYILYNFLEDEEINSINIPFISITAPLVFRIGLTYKF